MTDIVVIHANWCGHCKTLMEPKGPWKTMKTLLKDKKHITIHEIENDDGNKEDKLRMLNGKIKGDDKITVKGFPTIVKLVGGEKHEFAGMRTGGELAKWAENGQRGGKKTKRRRVKKSKRNTSCKSCSWKLW